MPTYVSKALSLFGNVCLYRSFLLHVCCGAEITIMTYRRILYLDLLHLMYL